MLRSFTRFYSARPLPKSLLVKQSNRLNKKDGESSKMIVTSLRDILSLFQANSQTLEDEEMELLNHKAHLRALIESGELERLADAGFQLNRSTNKIPTQSMINKFSKLSSEEAELINEATALANSKPWTESPSYVKQLAYYLSFGSYGPRSDIPFRPSEKPLDFIFKSRCIKGPSSRIKKLDKSQLVEPWKATKSRQRYLSGKSLDPMSKFIVWSAICVSLIVGWQEWNLKSQDEASAKL